MKWTIEDEMYFIEFFYSFIDDPSNYSRFKEEFEALNVKRNEYLNEHFGKDWFFHMEGMKEANIPIHEMTKKIAQYWYDIGYVRGYSMVLNDGEEPPQEGPGDIPEEGGPKDEPPDFPPGDYPEEGEDAEGE